jgi:hypothetical protein
MAASGEPYSVAARNLDAAAAQPTDATVAEILAWAERTLADSSARIALRSDFEYSRPETQASPSPIGRLIGLAGKAVWELASGGKEFGHSAGEGFLEPAATRYMIDFGHYAQICKDGMTFGGRSGRSLQTLRPSSRHEGDVLWLLRLAAGATEAHPELSETLRGTLCRKYAVRSEAQRAAAASGRTALLTPLGVNSRQPETIALTVWIDEQHIRQIRFEDRVGRDQGGSGAKILTLELWDFGVPVRELDWSRLPTFRTPS